MLSALKALLPPFSKIGRTIAILTYGSMLLVLSYHEQVNVWLAASINQSVPGKSTTH